MLDLIQLDEPEIAVRIAVNRRARRLTLRLAPGGGGAVLTLPPGVPAEAARDFVRRHSGWLARALARQGQAVPVVPGAVIPVDGAPRRIVLGDGPRQAPVLEAERLLLQGQGRAGPRLAAWLKARGRDRMAPAATAHARMLGVPLAAVSLRDTRSRWGSCSSARRISLSWRLAMAPVVVQDYVAAHEVAHLVEMNHSPDYWAVLERLMPGYREPRAWLRRNGAGLHLYRFD
ncbi:MAG TPA: SprT family zinc-dependent metalloprotease [Thermohalobaculum sp.]|nr:SprT family zinc-dependent metalloprotease [Thermohalobaculum sp.]